MLPTSSSDQDPKPDTGLAGDLWLASSAWEGQWQEFGTDLPDVLYHYTDAAGLLGIMQSGSLWATHARFVNDSGEIRYVEKVLHEIIESLSRKFPDAQVHEYLELVTELFQEIILNGFELYLACFCEYGDQLSQWRGYAAGGEGYAIGFHSDALSHGRLVRKVIYDQEAQRGIVREILEPACQLIYDAPDDQKADSAYVAKAIRTGAGTVVGNLGECSWTFKHPGFEEEAETRLVRASPTDRTSQFHQAPELRVRGSQLLPYTRVTLTSPSPPDSLGAIAGVIIGPNAHPKLAAQSVEWLLESCGYANASDMVHISGIPLRA